MPEIPEAAKSRLVKLVTNPISTWLIRSISAPLDPIVFRATNGKFTTMGPAGPTMITITMKGRKSGKERSVHLSFVEHEGDALVVASAMGQQKHPGWRYNLEANPDIEVQVKGERYRARAEALRDAEKDTVWDKIRTQIPMIYVYETRTDRNIRVFRIRRIDS